MTKYELARELAVSEHMHLSTAIIAIDGILRIISETLAGGDHVTLRGFGTFSKYDCRERTVRDFRTGDPVTIPAHRSAKFSASPQLVQTLNQGDAAKTPLPTHANDNSINQSEKNNHHD